MKAKICLTKIQEVTDKIVVEANVEIRGNTTVRQYQLPIGSDGVKIRKHIIDKLREEENENYNNAIFEVEI